MPQSGLFGTGKPRRNASKACEGCRRRKQKCNGLDPCDICLKRSLPCSYRTVTRQRQSHQGASSGRQPSSPHIASVTTSMPDGTIQAPLAILYDSQVRGVHAALSREQIFNCIRIIHAKGNYSSNCPEVVYGPSSNISLWRHFRAHLDPEVSVEAEHEHSSGSYEEVDDDLNTYKCTRPATLGLGHSINQAFVRYEVANSLTETFLRITHHVFPVVSSEELKNSLELLYDFGGDDVLPHAEKALLLASMAIGSAQGSPARCTDTLAAKARRELDYAGDALSFQAVQAGLLLISWFLISHNIGY
ncbi:hypothetical protein TruAng_011914 [Truncatella angustata]|nr:hypothetical protein TruAng_011914 [Truncatella angustata]